MIIIGIAGLFILLSCCCAVKLLKNSNDKKKSDSHVYNQPNDREVTVTKGNGRTFEEGDTI